MSIPLPKPPPRRTLGRTSLSVTPVAMGCWPIAGISSIDVTTEASLATLRAAYDAGINFFDTAYVYGYDGESERMVGEALADVRDDVVIATKCGLHWNEEKRQVRDASPETIRRECDESLRRLKTDRIDLYYLHAPDDQIPIADSAGAMRELLGAGKILAAGVSNFTAVSQYEVFASVCPIAAAQPLYNMLQREIEQEILPWCLANDVSVIAYWPLMKGILAGKLPRDHVWDSRDKRQNYPLFQGESWQKTQDFLDDLRPIADDAGITLAQLAVAWTIQRPGLTVALCGAKRPEQIQETAAAMSVVLTEHQLERIDRAIDRRGPVD